MRHCRGQRCLMLRRPMAQAWPAGDTAVLIGARARLGDIDSHEQVAVADPGTVPAYYPSMSSGPALLMPLAVVISVAMLALSGCGSSDGGASSAAGSSQA